MIDFQQIASCIPPRTADSHKGSYGTLLTVCGSYGMAGAAILSARAAYRCGTGLVAAALPENIYPIVAGAVPEAVCVPLAGGTDILATPWLGRADALLVGCGLGRHESVKEIVLGLLEQTDLPMVLDADGINALEQHIPIRTDGAPPLIVTPHPAEMARLLGCEVGQVQADRDGAAVAAARQLHAVAVLKGHKTVIATEEGVQFVNPTGNPGMATAGSGDVLAGMMSGLLAQGLSPLDAAISAVYLHGAAGDRAAARLSQQSMMAGDLIDELPALFLQMKRES